MQRRDFLATFAVAGLAAAQTQTQPKPPVQRKGRIKQALFRNVFGTTTTMSFDEMCRTAAELGCRGFDLVGPPDWPTLRKYGLVPTMAPSTGVTFQDGLIHKEAHDRIEPQMRAAIDVCAANGCPNMVTIGGQRRGMSYEEGADNAVAYLNRVKAQLEDKGVTLCLENMNNRFQDNSLGRPDQICGHVAWGFDVCKRVSSPRVKMLFDIYHAQIMDGNLCDTIRDNLPWIAHFHTAGVPGRHELDETQEINYRFVARTIADLGFAGYVAHEYRPTPGRDPLQSLSQTLDLMDV